MIYDTTILGAGPAGLTAAIYAARAGLSVQVLEGMSGGGQLTQTAEIENFPGFPEPIGGIELVDRIRTQAGRTGARFVLDEAVSIARHPSGNGFAIATMMGETLETKTVVVATGATAKWLGVPGEAKFKGHGVSACATCDGALFKGKDVAVIGGGDTALSEALYLAKICRKVYLIHRRDAFRATKVLVERVAAADNIECVMNANATEFAGEGRKLAALKLDTGAEIPLAGAFVAIGHKPQTGFLKGFVELDEAGYIKGPAPFTNVPGVFAAGDCADSRYRQAITAAASGAKAAMELASLV